MHESLLPHGGERARASAQAVLRRAPRVIAATCHVLWLLLLASPAASSLWFGRDWGVQPAWLLLLVSSWILASAYVLLPARIFFVATYPLALIAAAAASADFARSVSLLDLAGEWRTFSKEDVIDALAPYWRLSAGGAIFLAVLAWLGVRFGGHLPRPALRWRIAAVVAGAALAVPAPALAWLRAWPVSGIAIAVDLVRSSAAQADGVRRAMTQSPRDPAARWEASRASADAVPQTVVLVIGETLRADHLQECGGRWPVRKLHAGALVACDMSAGADNTAHSVPLLISRELPGHMARVSRDGTFQRAFAEAGFSTFWLGTQEQSVAWTDAATARFAQGPDRRMLLPMLDEALASATRSASIVLHGYGAHIPYCQRFDRTSAPLPDACDGLREPPDADSIADWRAMYANAVDASLALVNDVIARLERVDGEVFLVFTSDHGEDLQDDGRRWIGHAHHRPSRWSAQVPAIFWANAAWRAGHPAAWAQLQANVARPLMHADVVPTLLGAAQIRYREPRTLPVDLLAAPVPSRRRIVHANLGQVVDWESLVREADAARAEAP